MNRFPEKHQFVQWEPWLSMGLRQMPVDHYIVYFLADKEKETVSVVRILYGGRDVRRVLLDSI